MPVSKLTINLTKLYASLKNKKFRRQHGLFIADGVHLVEEAIKANWPIKTVIVRSDCLEYAAKLGIDDDSITIADTQHFNRISPSSTPQGILAILRTADQSGTIPEIAQNAGSIIACDNISDPGNLGTIIRTAAAFTYDAVVLVGNCADIYNPKTISATQGAVFNIPIVEINSVSTFLNTFSGAFKLISLSGDYSTKLSNSPEIERPLLIVGGETAGISPEIEVASPHRFRIEQSNKVDSLNASVAAGIAMYMLRRR